MKKSLILLVLATTLSFSKIVTIIDNGVERKIYLPIKEGVKARALNTQSKGIIIAFKSKKIDFSNFEKNYHLQLKKSLKAGYKIYLNNSNLSDIELISKISKERLDIIKTIRPNWGFGMIAR